jgi:hypothetical protein
MLALVFVRRFPGIAGLAAGPIINGSTEKFVNLVWVIAVGVVIMAAASGIP